MKKVKNVLLVILSVVFVASMLQTVFAADKVKLKMYAYQDLADPVTRANWEQMLEAFGKEYPDIELEIEYGVDEAYHTKLQTMVMAGQIPDVVRLWPGKRTVYITSQGVIKDLRPLIKGHEAEFVPGALGSQGPNGEIYELPQQMETTHIMYTNERLLKELGLTFPKTMDELIAQGETIRNAGLIPIAMTNKAGWQMQSCFLSALAERAGGMEWYTKAITGDGASFADPEFVNALSVIETLMKNEMFLPGINQADYGAALTEFVNERAVYYIDGGWRINNMVGELKAEQKEYISLRTFPDIPNQKGTSGSTALVTGDGYGMSASLEGEKAEAAWKWIWFFCGPVGSKIRQSKGMITAYNLPVNEDLDIMIKKLAKFVSETPGGYVLDGVMDAEGMGVLQQGMQEMMLGAKTPEQVATEYEAWVAANDSNRKK
ncbi:extracellular solute-binding protein family 1 [Candidatus Vecturithrix granuli]|uniref:Extracellular solute-binding protein family 1 n=1 Tax=Vecturithrix granuli TaxID=1499967 RepID=A0A081C7I9_VECG1|nr:extracellular solute-binding protein family 1 [Candidatus Vecturithrix granuli]